LEDWWIREWTNAYTLVHDQIYNVASTLSTIIVSWSFMSSSQTIYNTLSTFSLPQLITSSFNTSTSSNDYESLPIINLEQNESQVDVNYYLGIYVLIGLLTALFGSFRTYYLFMGSLAASRKLHKAILDRVFRAKVRLFDTTPMGIYLFFYYSWLLHVDMILLITYLLLIKRSHIESIFQRYRSN
jgi:hypothetical protein